MIESATLASLSARYRQVPARRIGLRVAMEDGICVLRNAQGSSRRRILYVSNYGMAQAWRLWESGVYPGHHLWGCLELAEMGYEVLLPEPASGRGLGKRLRNDWLPSLIASRRLRADDIVYCSHNILLWTTLLKAVRAIRCKIVGLLFAREPLFLARLYDGVIAHTPVAAKHATAICPSTLCAHISWGMDLDFLPLYPYEPQWFLSCGKTFRDFDVISEAFHGLDAGAVVIHPKPQTLTSMPANVDLVSAGRIGEGIYAPLAHHFYRHTTAVLLTLLPDPTERHAVGLTNLFEAMASGRPAIVTRTSALTSEIDVDKEGIGLYVNPSDPSSLREAVARLSRDRDEARQMGLRGRQLCERHYNMSRFAGDLHAFFEKL